MSTVAEWHCEAGVIVMLISQASIFNIVHYTERRQLLQF